MKTCDTCKHYNQILVPCYGCINMRAWEPKPQTHADRIRAMTDEELAEWLCDIAGWLPMYEGKMHPILDWLKEEADT